MCFFELDTSSRIPYTSHLKAIYSKSVNVVPAVFHGRSSIISATISVVQLSRINVTTEKQRSCTALDCEHEKYIIDIFSYIEPGHHGQNEPRQQLFLYITRAEGNGRKGFLQVIIEGKKIILPITSGVPIIALK